jgi:hypothetical protein
MIFDIYRTWIHSAVANVGHGTGYGICREISEAMAREFPEMQVRKGIFKSVTWGHREHWWCRIHRDIDESTTDSHRAANGRIVDPTALQYPDGMLFPMSPVQYCDLTDVSRDEAIDRGLIPTGTCPNCSEMIYRRRDGTCSDACAESYARYLNGD